MENHPIPPVYDKNSKILILGSFPSVKSREHRFPTIIKFFMWFTNAALFFTSQYNFYFCIENNLYLIKLLFFL